MKKVAVFACLMAVGLFFWPERRSKASAIPISGELLVGDLVSVERADGKPLSSVTDGLPLVVCFERKIDDPEGVRAKSCGDVNPGFSAQWPLP